MNGDGQENKYKIQYSETGMGIADSRGLNWGLCPICSRMRHRK